MKPFMDRNEFEEVRLKPKPEQFGNHNDFRLFYDNTDLANGWVKLCDKDGIPIAMVGGVSQIYISKRAAGED